MDNSSRLLSLYNDLDDALREKYHDNNRSNSVVLRYINSLNHSGNNNLIKIGKKLNMIRVLRNNLIHELDMNSESLIDVTDECIDFLEKVVDQIVNPTTAKDLFTNINNAYTIKFDSNEPLLDITNKMREKGFTQVPVLNHQGIVKGVLSPNALFGFLNSQKNVCLSQLNFQDIYPYLSIEQHFSETYRFIPEYLSEQEISDLFLESFENNKKLAMCFVTKTGKSNEPLLGLIVPKDIITHSK